MAWDQQVSRCLLSLCGDLTVRQLKPEAVACITGVILPSHQERMIKVSEAYLRLSNDNPTGQSGRHRWQHHVRARTNRLARAVHLAEDMGLLFERTRKSDRAWRVSATFPASARAVGIREHGADYNVVCDLYGTWGHDVHGWPTISVCTDGSLQGAGDFQVSSWAVVFLDDWFRSNWATVPREGCFTAGSLDGVASLSGRVPLVVGCGVFDAELQAIARALVAVPVTCNLIIHTDSESAIKAIERFRTGLTVRQRQRTSGRQWLSFIIKVLRERDRAAASTNIQWVGAHSDDFTMVHIGNRCADELAKRASSLELRRSQRDSTVHLPLEQEDPWVSLRFLPARDDEKAGRLVTGDPRKVCMRQLRNGAAARWRDSRTQSMFSGEDADTRALWSHVAVHRPRLCRLTLLILTNTIHWRRSDANSSQVIELRCSHCHVISTFSHVRRVSSV